MWGICFDVSVLGGALCQNVVEYETINDGDTALIINPVKDIEIPIEKIRINRLNLFTGIWQYLLLIPN